MRLERFCQSSKGIIFIETIFVVFYFNVLKGFKNTVFKDSVNYFGHNFVSYAVIFIFI